MKNSPESLDPASIAEQQRQLGAEWAEAYAREPSQSAEIALRNPTVYLRDVAVSTLPERLQAGWAELLDTSEKLVSAAETTKTEWGTDVSGIEKLQGRMFSGNLKPEYREPIAEVIRGASVLFADSSQFRPGNTNYYAGNVHGMRGWLDRHQR